MQPKSVVQLELLCIMKKRVMKLKCSKLHLEMFKHKDFRDNRVNYLLLTRRALKKYQYLHFLNSQGKKVNRCW